MSERLCGDIFQESMPPSLCLLPANISFDLPRRPREPAIAPFVLLLAPRLILYSAQSSLVLCESSRAREAPRINSSFVGRGRSSPSTAGLRLNQRDPSLFPLPPLPKPRKLHRGTPLIEAVSTCQVWLEKGNSNLRGDLSSCRQSTEPEAL